MRGYFYLHRTPKLNEKDTVVLADFTNTTGDPIFDGTLRQGLSCQLEQSPFLNLLSDERIAQTLSLIAQPKDTRLTHELAREVCQRTASTAVLNGSIAQVGSQYLLTLKAVQFRNGKTIVEGLPLERFVGPDGLMMLFSFLAAGSLPRGEILEIAKRVQIPGYVLARSLLQESTS